MVMLLTQFPPSLIKKIYNLKAQSHVAGSFEVPEYTVFVDAIGSLEF